jgi:membrane protease YdiL (CAAX protease family)
MNFELLTRALNELVSEISIVELVLVAGGVIILAAWLYKTSFGVKALADAPVRRIDMPIQLVVIPFFLWILSYWVLDAVKRSAFPDLADWQDAFADNLVMCLSSAPPIAAVLFIAFLHYARRLKGLGLNPKTIVKDLPAACLNLVVILPAVSAAANLTMLAAQFFAGPGFEWPKHEELKLLLEYPQHSLRVLVVIATILIVPVMEEVLFRGLVQTVIRSYLAGLLAPAKRSAAGWLSIIFASLVFIVFHVDKLHWPALFVLSLCLGYSYEKSGSLFRPIFIHSLFNALNVFAALSQ